MEPIGISTGHGSLRECGKWKCQGGFGNEGMWEKMMVREGEDNYIYNQLHMNLVFLFIIHLE